MEQNYLTMNDIYEYNSSAIDDTDVNDFFEHYGILGMKWGIRKYQNADGTLTAAGRARYGGNAKYGYRKDQSDLVVKTIKKGTKLYRITAPGEEIDGKAKYVYYSKADDSNIKAIIPWLASARGKEGSSIEEQVSSLRKNTYELNSDMKIAPVSVQREYQKQILKNPKMLDSIVANSVANGYSHADVEIFNKMRAVKTKKEQDKIMDSAVRQQIKEEYGDLGAAFVKAEVARTKRELSSLYDKYVAEIDVTKARVKNDPELSTRETLQLIDFSIGGVKKYQEGLYKYIKDRGYNAMYDAAMNAEDWQVIAEEALIVLDDSIMTKVSEKQLTVKDYTKASIKAATWRTKVNRPYDYQSNRVQSVVSAALLAPIATAAVALALVP